MNNLAILSDKELYAECKKWGLAALQARWRFAGFLPEVYRRRLYEKRGFSCIYEFAARLAGMSRGQVDQVLRLEKRFQDKPVLKDALINGEVSVNKLARIASIATEKNQEEILAKTETLSKAALEIFVKENKNANGFAKRSLEAKSVPGQGISGGILHLEEDVLAQLGELQKKGIDINDLIRKFLKEREERINRKMEEISRDVLEEERCKKMAGVKPSRYKRVRITRILEDKYGDKCSVDGCLKPSSEIHHEKLFGKYGSHDPRFLRPLCVGHHEIAHVNDEKVQEFRVEGGSG